MWLCHRPNVHHWVRRRVDSIAVLDEATVSHEIVYFLDLSRFDRSQWPAGDTAGCVQIPIERRPRRTHIVTSVMAPGLGELVRPIGQRERACVLEGLQEKWGGEEDLDWARIETVLSTPLGELKYAYRGQKRRDLKLSRAFNRQSRRELRATRRADLLRETKAILVGLTKRLLGRTGASEGPTDVGGGRIARRDVKTQYLKARSELKRQRADVRELFRKQSFERWVTGRVAFECAEPLYRQDRKKGEQFGADLARWLRNYMLLVEIPDSAFLSDHKAIITVRYEESIPSRRLRESRSFRVLWFRSFLLLTKLAGGSVSTALSLSVRAGVGTAESSHFSIVAPPGFRSIDNRLEVKYGGYDEQVVYRDDDNLPSTGHIHLARDPHFVEEANLIFNAYTYKSGFFIESLVSSWLILAVVLPYFLTIRHAGFVLNPKTGAGPLHSEIAAGIILFLPTVVVAVITQRDRSRIASRCFAVPRLVLTLSALAAGAGAMTIALDVSVADTRTTWTIAVWVVIGAAIRLSIGAIVHIYRCSYIRLWALKRKWARDDKKDRDLLARVATEPTIGI